MQGRYRRGQMVPPGAPRLKCCNHVFQKQRKTTQDGAQTVKNNTIKWLQVLNRCAQTSTLLQVSTTFELLLWSFAAENPQNPPRISAKQCLKSESKTAALFRGPKTPLESAPDFCKTMPEISLKITALCDFWSFSTENP